MTLHRWALPLLLAAKAAGAFVIPRIPHITHKADSQASSFSSKGYMYQPQSISLLTHPRLSSTRLFLSPDLNSNDPFAILGLDPNDRDSLDKKVIKRAYKRMALKFHPDVATNKDSTEQEKKQASDQFAKINAAYETLLGKRGDGSFGSQSGTARTGTAGHGWTPPHRRKPGDPGYASSYGTTGTGNENGSTRSGSGTSWEDFMPKYDDAQYDTGGDSFGAIFADLLAGAAGTVGSRGGAGVIQDFVEFLERNVDGYSTVGSNSGDNDPDLTYLLQTGSVDEIGEELDEADLVVQQLSTKMKDLDNEIISLQADLSGSSRFSEKIALEEKIAECEARKSVVENYMRRARKRLLALQTRYKQLIVGGANDSKAGGRASRDRNGKDSATTTSSTRRGESARSTASGTTRQQTRSSSGTSSGGGDAEDAWKSQGFGSNGRGRGSSRRRASRANTKTSTESPPASAGGNRQSYDDPSSPWSAGRSQSSSTSQSSTSSSYSSEYNVPPHRRSRSNQAQDDKERLRQLKVEDEFEKLKKDLGL